MVVLKARMKVDSKVGLKVVKMAAKMVRLTADSKDWKMVDYLAASMAEQRVA